MPYSVEIREITKITHDVRAIKAEKPKGYSFEPGEATEVAIDKDGWRDEKRPFTFTSLNSEDHLEFIIKIYPDHNGITEQIGHLKEGDALIIENPWGTIQYSGEGVFLAGGAGITPFIAILRDLHQRGETGRNRLIFSNKSERDIILQEEFEEILGDRCLHVITDEQPGGDHLFLDGFINKDVLKEHISDFGQPFYVCGPPPFNESIIGYLKELGAEPEALVFEE